MERALELLTLVAPDGFGVFQKKWFSNFALLPVLAALRAYIEDRGLGEGSRNDLRRWYWCNVFLERYSSGVESKSRKDYSEMLAYWVGNGPEPTVYAEARAQIGGKGYTVRDSASYASAVYSGMFSLLALRGARDWMRGEVIQLQNLHDHHIFPREYLKRHGILKRTEINNLANRTLISDETNRRIAAKAPADYLRSRDVFPRGSNDELLTPHFLGKSVVRHLSKATDDLSETDVTHIYEGFCRAREAAMIAEIRKVCGIAEE